MAKAINIAFLEAACPKAMKDRSYDAMLTWLFGTDERSVAVCEKSAYENVKKRSSEIKHLSKQDRQTFKDDVNKLIADCLDDLFKGGLTERKAFDYWHFDSCSKIYDALNWMENVSYGLAQMWLNLTVKNMLIMERWDEQLEPIKNHLHIPVDSFVIDAASKLLSVNVPVTLCTEHWWQWGYGEYMKFQYGIRNAVVCPMDWEFGVWGK